MIEVERLAFGDASSGGTVVQVPPAFAPPVSFPGAEPSAGRQAATSAAPEQQDPQEELKRLRELREQNLITEDEYEEKRKAMLDSL